LDTATLPGQDGREDTTSRVDEGRRGAVVRSPGGKGTPPVRERGGGHQREIVCVCEREREREREKESTQILNRSLTPVEGIDSS
jgi:hypothetical protein